MMKEWTINKRSEITIHTLSNGFTGIRKGVCRIINAPFLFSQQFKVYGSG